MVHFYIGDGKGKTTAALGLALRAAGFGKKVYVAQFLKGRNIPSGFIKALASCRLPLKIERFSHQIHPLFQQGKLPFKKKEIRASTAAALDKIEKFLEKNRYEVIVLDEILNSLDQGFCSLARLKKLIKKASRTEIIMTGRTAPPELCHLADYLSVIVKEKHPFDRGVRAREGIEY